MNFKTYAIQAICFLLLAAAIPAMAGGASVERDKKNPHFVYLKNGILTIMVDLSRGGRVGSFVYKGFEDQDVIYEYQRGNGGMFKDLFTTQGWPGEFNKRTYDLKIVKNGPDEAVITASTMTTGAYKNQVKENLKDLLLEKTFRIKAGSRVLTVELALTNKGEKGKRPPYWSQNVVAFDDQRGVNNYYWRPTREWTDWISYKKRSSNEGHWYPTKVRAGWNGVSNPKVKRGMMFYMDYNDLDKVYDNTGACTIEWMYDQVAIPVGRTWTTVMKAVPTEGFATYTWADEHVIAAFETIETPAGLKVNHTITVPETPLTDVTIQTVAKGITTKWEVAGAPAKTARLDTKALNKSVDLRGTGELPCIVEVTVTGKNPAGKTVSTTYANYHGGKAGRNRDLETLLPLYEFKAPPKEKQYLKPDKIKIVRGPKPRVLFMQGLWAPFHGVREALAQIDDVEISDGWMKKAPFGETVSGFPAGYDELLKYDLIVLANMGGGQMLNGLSQEMLADYVKAGGGLLLLSGDRTYGQANFKNENFLNVLPVTFHKYGDYGKLAKPSSFQQKDRHPIATGVTLPAGEVALYRHHITPKTSAKTVLTFNTGEPAVIATAGEQRVVVVAALPFGEASAGKTLYFRGKGWQTFMVQTMKWLSRR